MTIAPFTFDVTKQRHIGGRDEQQDAVDAIRGPTGQLLLVLADGMGGHRGGALASAETVRIARETIAGPARDRAPDELLALICEQAHLAINTKGAESGLEPRSTVVLLLLRGSRAHWAHLGDSRLYRFRGGRFAERTLDHSVAQMLVLKGKIREEEMADHPDQSKLFMSLGGDETPEPEMGQERLQDGDVFVLCSDGLWGRVSPQEMVQASHGPDWTAAMGHLVALAVERGGSEGDNVSLAAVRVAAKRNPLMTAIAGKIHDWLEP